MPEKDQTPPEESGEREPVDISDWSSSDRLRKEDDTSQETKDQKLEK